MNCHRVTLTLCLAAVYLTCCAPIAMAFSLFPKADGEVLVVTDLTEEGRKRPDVTPEAPVYYLGMTLGARLGSIGGDKEPDQREVERFVTRLLAKRGFKGARGTTHPPTLFIVIQWGYMRPNRDSLWFLGYNARDDIAAPSLINMLGAEVLLRNMRSREIETILMMAQEDLYGIIITAFDHDSAKTQRPVALWQTRIALPAARSYMQEALPKMLVLAADQIGRETAKPVFHDPSEPRNPSSTFGELQVLGWEHVLESPKK